MRFRGRKAYLVALLVLPVLFSHWCPALQIRSYTPSRHDRFTGYPADPAFNAGAWFGSTGYSGVGWIPPGTDPRQFTLVSPKHIVCATHYQPGAGTPIRFLSSGGAVVDRTIIALQTVLDAQGNPTDLTLGTLSAAIEPSEGVAPLPYLQLAAGEDYPGKFLTVFGWHAKAAAGIISGLQTYTDTGTGGTTRVFSFDYDTGGGGQDDAYLEVGDSGSPSFCIVNGQPALVGLHFLIGEQNGIKFNYDTLVPNYIAELNALMLPEGYQMTPLATSTRLGAGSVQSPTTLKQGQAGTCTFTLFKNPSPASNVKFTLEFDSGEAPSGISASGWTILQISATNWELTRASMNSSSNITASWGALPPVTTLRVRTTFTALDTALSAYRIKLAVLPTFAGWASGLPDATREGDPDADGISNLVEYAFGSSPQNGIISNRETPALVTSNGSATFSFPVRSDAGTRGISYLTEYSQTLDADSWTTSPPPGMTSQDVPWDPARSGFLKREIAFPAAGDRHFVRVRILLTE